MMSKIFTHVFIGLEEVQNQMVPGKLVSQTTTVSTKKETNRDYRRLYRQIRALRGAI
jgi:hypothetical protein